MVKKIKFTSKRDPKPSKLERAAGEQRGSSIYYQGERIGSVEGEHSYNTDMRPQTCLFETKRTPRPQVCSKLG